LDELTEESDGLRFTAKALEEGPSDTVVVTPVSSTVSTGEVVSDPITAYQHRAFSFAFGIVDGNGDPINLDGKTVTFKAYRINDKQVVFELSGAEVVVSGNQVTVSSSDTNTEIADTFGYILSNET